MYMRKINTRIIEEKIYGMALQAGVNLSPSCKDALNESLKNEESEAAIIHFIQLFILHAPFR